MWLLVGLGNPGRDYAGNRHNIGFMALDAIVRRHGFSGYRSSKFSAEIAEGALGGERVLALKPLTFMNVSGEAVGAAARFYKIPPEAVIVIHDEVDLAAGKPRTKRGGGHGGHNGLRSIDQHIGTSYRRLRLGIGHPGSKERMTGHVLGDFTAQDRIWLDPLLDAVADHAALLLSADEAAFSNKLALALRSV
ncbi:MAG: aminoacyl-tRNA hydrolase [Alphaproteobacteria bacterium]|nr:MAG: aminoacyl-tRNA hydrolase [Alphaproteobacteria bacterium]